MSKIRYTLHHPVEVILHKTVIDIGKPLAMFGQQLSLGIVLAYLFRFKQFVTHERAHEVEQP